jgi:hypothetical protein
VKTAALVVLALIVSARTCVTVTVVGTPVAVPALWLIALAVVLVLAALLLWLLRTAVRDGGWLRLRPRVVTT